MLTNHCLCSIQSRMKEIRVMPFNYVFLEFLWNKLCVDLIGPYKIRRKGKEPLILKAVAIIYPVPVWFEVTHYSNKKEITIRKIGINYVAGPLSVSSRNHV